MSKKADPKLVGIFVLGALSLIVAAVLVFGSGRFFKERITFVSFFETSAQGLDVGAPVTLKGVRIGSVKDVSVVFDVETPFFVNQVIAEVEPERVLLIGGHTLPGQKFEDADSQERIDILTKSGLRAQLQLQSLLTAKLSLALELLPDTEVVLMGLNKEYPELPAVPTDLENLTEHLKKLKLVEMVTDVRNAVAGVDRLVNSPELTESVKSLNQALKDFGKMARSVDSQVDPLASSIQETLGDTRKLVRNVDSQVETVVYNLNDALGTAKAALEQTKETLASYEGILAEESPLNYQLNEALKQVGEAANSISVLTEYLGRHPGSVLRGKREPRR
jgi:paraquat-inducible protein B